MRIPDEGVGCVIVVFGRRWRRQTLQRIGDSGQGIKHAVVGFGHDCLAQSVLWSVMAFLPSFFLFSKGGPLYPAGRGKEIRVD